MRILIIRLMYYGYRVLQFFFRPITLGVRVMLVRERQVLLIRHTYMKGWYLPGGGLKRGETLEQAARREIREEAGADMGELKLVGAYSYLKSTKSDHNVLFLCTDFKWNGHHDAEVAEARFFPLDALPEDTGEGHRRKIEAYAHGQAGSGFGEW